MKNLILALALFSSSFAFAGTGGGSVTCNVGAHIVAVYSWFHSRADRYSELTVFVQAEKGLYDQYSATAELALQDLKVTTRDGRVLTVSPNLRNSNCEISEK